ncbi:MAG: ParB/RepB/Spo0J family partition protein [Thermomicrobia bacterium]|nr:ParB/RepB/Spo0J family partition protein [Thermomicrobia bacterium]
MSSKPRKFAVVADLLKDTSSRGAGVEEMMNAKQIRQDRIVPDPDQPRKSFPQESLEELAVSLKARGILQPIAVWYDRPHDRYVILHGERRWRAAGIAGLETLPAIVREDQASSERLIDQLMENLQREDLNDVDRADGLAHLKEAMVMEAVRRIRMEAKTPREPEPRMNLRGLLPAGQTLPAMDAAALRDVQASAERLLRYLLAMSTEPLDPAEAKRLRPLIRRLRDIADLYLDSVKE